MATHPTIFGQPRGLGTLFFTEMWERFTYYGMRAILILFLVTAAREGGLGLDDRTASSGYGLDIAATYLVALLGGWIADRLIGAQRAVIGGAILIAMGNAMLMVGGADVFFLGLVVSVLGVGLLKPNISVMVAHLYPEGGARRDAGFSIFYMGINVGAFMGSVLVPLCAARFGWRWGFMLPAVGMLFGLVQFMVTRRWLGQSGLAAHSTPAARSWIPVIVFVVAVTLVAALAMTGRLTINAAAVSDNASWVIAIIAGGYFLYLVAFAGLTTQERRRVYVMMVLFAGYAMFFAGFEQGGASLNLFADRYVDRVLLGGHMPAGVLQAVTPMIAILCAPLFAALWLTLSKRGGDLMPSTKFAAGLALLGGGFLVMYVASRYVLAGAQVLPTWLIATYVLQEWGDLCLSPVGLSSMTRLAPPRLTGQIMGIWFLALALGNNVAGQLSRQYDASKVHTLSDLFLEIFWFSCIGATAMLLATPMLRRWMAGVK
ncbi:MAG: peptide MFS transporter [Steroidobacteraceae bacterium]